MKEEGWLRFATPSSSLRSEVALTFPVFRSATVARKFLSLSFCLFCFQSRVARAPLTSSEARPGLLLFSFSAGTPKPSAFPLTLCGELWNGN